MKLRANCQTFLILLFYCAYDANAAQAANSHQIHVKLFGQPCLLEGPVDEDTLKTIHSISPEELYPVFEPGLKHAKVKTALEKLRALRTPLAGLDLYREQLLKRLEAQASFLKGLDEALVVKKSFPLVAGVRAQLSDAKFKSFENMAKKLDGGLTPAQRKDLIDQLFFSYNEALPSDPEEEFHRAIHKMKIQYLCSFEDTGEGSGESADEN